MVQALQKRNGTARITVLGWSSRLLEQEAEAAEFLVYSQEVESDELS